MPNFEMVSLAEAEMKSATGRRAEITREYLGYIDQLQRGEAGRLEASEGESISAVRRRLGAAAKVAGKELVIKRRGDEIYFWVRPGKRRGRPPKQQSA